MNKKILCMLTPILVLPFFVLGKKANAYNIVEQPICGLAINTATCKSLNDYETYDKIYTNEFLDNTKLYETALSYHSFGTFKENTKEYLNIDMSRFLAAGCNISMSQAFQNVLDAKTEIITNDNNYYNKYYALYYEYVETKKYSLVNDDADESSLSNINNMSIGFKNSLEKLANGQMSYSNFFDRFGTHVVTSVIYGGLFTASSSVYSNVSTDQETFSNEMFNYFKYKDNFVIGTNESAAAYTKYFSQTEYTVVKEKCTAVGGTTYPHTNITSDIWSDVASWCSTVRDLPQPISYGNNGLKGIWNILPEKYSNLVTKMSNEYYNYCRAKSILKEDSFDYSQNLFGTKYYGNITGTDNITDDFDVNVYEALSGLTNVSFSNMKKYKTLCIRADFNLVAKNSGWDTIKITGKYNNKDTQIYYYKHDSSSGDECTCSFNFNIDLNSLSDENIVFAFGAYGAGSDDWKCNKFRLTYNLNK